MKCVCVTKIPGLVKQRCPVVKFAAVRFGITSEIIPNSLIHASDKLLTGVAVYFVAHLQD